MFLKSGTTFALMNQPCFYAHPSVCLICSTTTFFFIITKQETAPPLFPAQPNFISLAARGHHLTPPGAFMGLAGGEAKEAIFNYEL